VEEGSDTLRGADHRAVRQIGGADLFRGGPVNGGLLALTPEAWYDAFNVHVHPIFHLCRAVVPDM